MEKISNEQELQNLLEAERARKNLARRDMLRGLSAGAVAAIGGLVMAGCSSGHSNSNNNNGNNNGATPGTARDVDILNFALNLEYLEAEFYTYATTGKGIEAQGIATSGQNGTGGSAQAGTTTGGAKVNFDNSVIATVASQLAFDERTHVTDLRSTITSLGGTPVAKPNINLAALAPQGVDISTTNGWLIASRAFEDTGVSAYGGAARFINNKDILRASARILAVESYHAANIRLLIAQRGLADPATDALDVPPPPTGQLYFAVDSNALAIIRTPRQVLNIVLATPNSTTATTGGFFPSGAYANLATLTSLT